MALTKATQNVLEGIVSTGSTGISAGLFIVAQQYKITALGTTTLAQWNTIAGTTGQTYVVGSLFTAATTGASSGTGAAAVARTLANRFADVVNVKDFGAAGDGVADDTAAFSAGCAYLSSIGGGTLYFSKKHLIDQNLTIPRNVTISGVTGRCDPGNSFVGRVNVYSALQNVPKLIINPSVSIQHLGSGEFNKVYFTRKGLALDGTDLATNYSGTALVTGQTDSVFVTDCSFLGFERASDATGTARTEWNNVFIDCNNGIRQTDSNDQNKYNHIHCYNVLQSGVLNNSDPRTLRNGKAFEFTGSFNGGPTLFDCFEYGYTEGFSFSCQGSYKLIGCWSDGPSDSSGSLNPNSVGILIRSKTNTPSDYNAEVQIIGFTAAAKGTGIAIGTPAIPNTYGTMYVNTAHIFLCNVGINCYAQKLICDNVAIRSYYQTAILFNSKSSADSSMLTNIYFYDAQATATCEINYGGGEPYTNNIVAVGRGRYLNCVPYSATRDGTGMVLIEDSRDQINITATGGTIGQIGDIFPKRPGRVITITFISNGFSINNDANFRLVGAGNLIGGIGTSITLKRNNADTQWVEQTRSVF